MTRTERRSSHKRESKIDPYVVGSASLIAKGAGRQSETLLALSEAGISRYGIADFDLVNEQNLGQTSFRPCQIGKFKVDACAEDISERNPNAITKIWRSRGEEIPDLASILPYYSCALIGVDNPASMFRLADICQSAGVDTFVCGTTGDASQHFIAFVHRKGPPLKDLLPMAWEGVQSGYKPPLYFPSCRAFTQILNAKVVLAVLGILHFRAQSPLRIAEVGEELIKRPLVIGSNGVHGNQFTPTTMLTVDEIRGL